jgi:hypothetical protein
MVVRTHARFRLSLTSPKKGSSLGRIRAIHRRKHIPLLGVFTTPLKGSLRGGIPGGYWWDVNMCSGGVGCSSSVNWFLPKVISLGIVCFPEKLQLIPARMARWTAVALPERSNLLILSPESPSSPQLFSGSVMLDWLLSGRIHLYPNRTLRVSPPSPRTRHARRRCKAR